MDKTKVAAWTGLGFPAANLGAILVNVSGTGTLHPFATGDEFRSAITAGAVVDTVLGLAASVSPGGLLGCEDFSFSNTNGADPASEAIYFFIDSGNTATDRIIAYYDTVSGLPVTPDGNNIDVDCSNGLVQL